MLRRVFGFYVALFFLSFHVFTHAAKIEHVIVISVDGLRPDAISKEKSPVIENLKVNGVWASFARTIPLSKTLPSHTSMLTGRSFEAHQVDWNDYMTDKKDAIKTPTCLKIVNENGLSSAMFVGKEKFKHLHENGATFHFQFPGETAPLINKTVLEYVKKYGLPNLMFIHYPEVDYAGHEYEWLSAKYFEALDTSLASIVNLVNQPAYKNNTVIILTSDHGGKGKTHGEDIPEHRLIPWIAYGASLKPGWVYNNALLTYDTAATALSLLGLSVPKEWEGKPMVLPMETLQPESKITKATKTSKKS